MKIYISTTAFNQTSLEDTIKICQEQDFNLEFSSGLPYRADNEELFLKAPIGKLPHNYFPAPKSPFVINLASGSKELRSLSIKHAKHGLELAKKGGSEFYAVHAGFCIDPYPKELDKKISKTSEFDRDYHLELFCDSLKILIDYSNQLGIDFYIENNVLSNVNFQEFNSNPFLCTIADDIEKVFKEVNGERFGLLLDTAHLKISCKSLNLDLNEEYQKIKNFIKALHHSDNDGKSDTNEKFDASYWFLKYLPDYLENSHVIEVKNISVDTIKNQFELLKSHGSK